MDGCDWDRQYFIFGLGGLGMGQMLTDVSQGGAADVPGSVLGPDGGEHLIHFVTAATSSLRSVPLPGPAALQWERNR
jgi:hypothetical protein